MWYRKSSYTGSCPIFQEWGRLQSALHVARVYPEQGVTQTLEGPARVGEVSGGSMGEDPECHCCEAAGWAGGHVLR